MQTHIQSRAAVCAAIVLKNRKFTCKNRETVLPLDIIPG